MRGSRRAVGLPPGGRGEAAAPSSGEFPGGRGPPTAGFPGTAREALTFYGDVFGCAVQLHTFAEFNRADGPADAIAHGGLTGGPVALSGADVSGDERPVRSEGMMLACLVLPLPRLCAPGFPGSVKVAGSWTTCRSGRGAHPTGKSSTVMVSTGSSGSRVTRATERLAGAPGFPGGSSARRSSVTTAQHPGANEGGQVCDLAQARGLALDPAIDRPRPGEPRCGPPQGHRLGDRQRQLASQDRQPPMLLLPPLRRSRPQRLNLDGRNPQIAHKLRQ